MTDLKGIRLLLVDDEDSFRLAMGRRLARRGIVLEEAAGAEECLAILKNRPIDLVVLDVKMPGMSGLEALRLIRQEYPKTEVILLTGHVTAQDGVEGIKSGAFDYLSKPVEIEHLLSKIAQAHEKILREEERRREAKLRAEMEQQVMMAQRLTALGTLAAGVAHEINNPLAIMKESAGWMRYLLQREEQTDMPCKKDLEMALDKIERGIGRATRITHQLLGFVRKDDSDFSEVDLRTLVDEAVELIKGDAANKHIEIVKEMDASLDAIWTDPYPLRQVMVNLLTNAIHATGPGGKIHIILEGIEREVALTVRDTGQGVPKENIGKIFDPFFSTKGPGEGTGLGLFVSRGIVEKLGGTITVESRVGHGASFHVRLPKRYRPKDRPGEKDR